jgi:hypothetical protein
MYCGKVMYGSKDEAKKAAKLINAQRDRNKIVGSYYCTECDAYHNTSQDQSSARVKWFERNVKKFNNKHR